MKELNEKTKKIVDDARFDDEIIVEILANYYKENNDLDKAMIYTYYFDLLKRAKKKDIYAIYLIVYLNDKLNCILKDFIKKIHRNSRYIMDDYLDDLAFLYNLDHTINKEEDFLLWLKKTITYLNDENLLYFCHELENGKIDSEKITEIHLKDSIENLEKLILHFKDKSLVLEINEWIRKVFYMEPSALNYLRLFNLAKKEAKNKDIIANFIMYVFYLVGVVDGKDFKKSNDYYDSGCRLLNEKIIASSN